MFPFFFLELNTLLYRDDIYGQSLIPFKSFFSLEREGVRWLAE